MILQRLHELAVRKQLSDDPAFVIKDIACRIDISDQGKFLGIHDLRQPLEVPAKSKKGKPRTVLSGGIPFPIPVRPVVWDEKIPGWKATDPAASGKEKPALFMADTMGRVLPAKRLIPDNQQAKFVAQRSTFWRFLRHVISATQSEPLSPLLQFSESLEDDEALAETIADQLESLKLTISNLCTLSIQSQMGRTILDSEELRGFWREFYREDLETQQTGAFRGLCQVTGETAAIGDSIKSRIKGLVSIGCRADAYLVTGLGSADSYNLNGARSAMVSEAGVDSFTRAANALIANRFDGHHTSYRIGGVMFLFWTRDDSDSGVFNLFEPVPESVAELLGATAKGRATSSDLSNNDFYMLILSGNSARVVVRDYLESPLHRLKHNMTQWFQQLRIADLSKEHQGQPTSLFPLWLLSLSTALDSDSVAPDTPSRLMLAAIQGRPIPESILVACLRRLRAEGASGFRPARIALIKVILIRKGVPMSETLDPDETHSAYLYGRMLCIFEQIQYSALGDVNANVVDKFYGVFSAAPALVFNRLFNNSQNHLRKLRTEKPSSFVALDKRLTELVATLPAAPPAGQLSARDQGRFALGYYHQRAKQFEEIAQRKAVKASVSAPPQEVQ